MTFKKAEKSFEASAKIGKYVREYWKDVYRAKEQGKKIAWVPGLAPVEVLEANDIVAIFPENYNALASAKQMGAELCEEAEARGFSMDVCSYGRLALGTAFSGKGPYGALPEPDFLFCTRNVCVTHAKWWESMSKLFNKPLFTLDVPDAHGQVTKPQLEYFKSQMLEFNKFLEKQTGKKPNEDRLMETLDLSNKVGELWNEIMDLRKTVPCPISSADIFGNMFLVVTVPGTQIALDLMTELRDEVKQRVANKQGAIPEEKFRLMWDNIAIWYNLGLMNYLEQGGAVSVIESYTCYTGWGKIMDLSKGLYEGLAGKYMPGYLNMDLDSKINLVERLADDYKVDGALLFSNRSCKPYSVGQYDIKAALEKKGIKSVMFEADMVDQRAYAAETIKNRLDAFLEMLENDKKR